MARRRFATRTGVVRSGSRRATQWLGSANDTDVTLLAAASVVLDQSFAFGEPATIVRTRGVLSVASDQTIASEFPFGAVGMAVVTDQAFAAGAGSIPAPYTESDADTFFLWEPFAAGMIFKTGVGIDTTPWTQIPFDSKAMRKVDDNSTAVVMIENASATDGLQFIITFRMLVMLHG